MQNTSITRDSQPLLLKVWLYPCLRTSAFVNKQKVRSVRIEMNKCMHTHTHNYKYGDISRILCKELKNPIICMCGYMPALKKRAHTKHMKY